MLVHLYISQEGIVGTTEVCLYFIADAQLFLLLHFTPTVLLARSLLRNLKNISSPDQVQNQALCLYDYGYYCSKS